ncbi:MAG: ATP-binding protein [Bacteroidota bacterium]
MDRLYGIVLILALLILSAIIWNLSFHNRNIKRENLLIQKRNQDLEEYNYEMGQFAFILSHNLKEPLRTISSFSSLLERRFEKKLDPSAKEYLGFIRNGAMEMTQLLADIRAFVDSRQAIEQVEIIDPNLLVQEIVDFRQVEIKNKGIKIERENLPSVLINEPHLRQVLSALIDNAIQYVPHEHGHIKIYGEETETESIIVIKDNGSGIDPQYHEAIFGLFNRLDKAKHEIKSGVGLALCKKVIEGQYDGKIWLESSLGQGASFFISLPKEGA